MFGLVHHLLEAKSNLRLQLLIHKMRKNCLFHCDFFFFFCFIPCGIRHHTTKHQAGKDRTEPSSPWCARLQSIKVYRVGKDEVKSGIGGSAGSWSAVNASREEVSSSDIHEAALSVFNRTTCMHTLFRVNNDYINCGE